MWRLFLQLAKRRQSGMSANPITDQDLEAFQRRARVRFTAWESNLIMRLDDALLASWAERGRKGGEKNDGRNTVSMDNPRGVRDFMSALTARQNARIAAQQARANR